MAQSHSISALTYLQNRPLTPAATFALQLAVVFVRWSERHRSRAALHELDDHLLRDIGLTRREAHKEAGKPFWQG